MTAFPLTALSAPLGAVERATLARVLRELLTWQRDLAKWPGAFSAPDATPIVSLYARGELCGCAGMSEGTPSERVLRAFVKALSDSRFGNLDASTRAELRAQISYAARVEQIPLAEATQRIEVATHGLAISGSARPVTLLPDVAKDNGLDAAGMLATLEQKAGTARAEWPEGGLYTFETESVLAGQKDVPELSEDPLEAAAAWLVSRVDEEGRVTFGLNPRTGESYRLSPMFHGRCAILLRALCAQKHGRGAAGRVRRWLESELTRALAGRSVEQFPEQPAVVAGTLALASLAGLEMTDALRAWAERPEVLEIPWHAAQVVAALGPHAPSSLWDACKRSLDAEPWAPWTALAAKARADAHTLERAVNALIAAVPASGVHIGGVGPSTVPELARTAATVEALKDVDSREARAACSRARAFLLRQQIRAENYAKSVDPSRVHGAFPQTPVHDFLQIDVTGHAVLALS